MLPPAKGLEHDDLFLKPQYFFSGDGKLGDSHGQSGQGRTIRRISPAPYKEASTPCCALIAKVKERHPNIEVGLTGLARAGKRRDDRLAKDSSFASWLALLGVAVLYFVVYRGFRFPLTTVASLMVGTVWALGWLTLTIGHLNILSSAFAVMLIGIGDYGVRG